MENYKLGESSSRTSEERDPEMWRNPQGGGIGSSPLIVDDLIVFGSYDTYFYALDKNTGELIWKFKTGDVTVSSAVAKNNILVFGSKDGFVYAVDLKTGILLWKYLTGGMVDTKIGLHNNNFYAGSSNGFLHCFSLGGELLWKYRAGNAINNPPSFVNDKLYFASYDKNFYSLNMEGQLIWKYYVGEWADTSPAIYANGEEVWSFAGEKRDYKGSASVCFGAYNKNFYVLDSENGALQWMRRMDGIINWSHPAVKDGKIYFGDWSGYLYCLNAENGSMEWKVLTGGNIDAYPFISDGYIYFGSYDGNIYVLSLDGKISWKYQTGGVVFSTPAISNSILYFGSLDSNFYAIDINTQRVVWKFVTGGGVPVKIKWLQIVKQIMESQKIFSAWKPELLMPDYKEDKNLTFVIPSSAYATQQPYKSTSPYEMQKKKKEPWER